MAARTTRAHSRPLAITLQPPTGEHTFEYLREHGDKKIMEAIEVLEKALEAVGKVEETMIFAEDTKGTDWMETAAGMEKVLRYLKSKPAATLAKETWG